MIITIYAKEKNIYANATKSGRVDQGKVSLGKVSTCIRLIMAICKEDS